MNKLLDLLNHNKLIAETKEFFNPSNISFKESKKDFFLEWLPAPQLFSKSFKIGSYSISKSQKVLQNLLILDTYH